MTVTAQAHLTSDQLRALDGYWRAANYLSVGQIYLMSNPLLTRAAAPGAHQAAAARPLGHHPGAEFPLGPPQPGDRHARREHDVRDRPGARRPGGHRRDLAGWQLYRHLSEHRPGHGRDGPAVPPVLLPRRGAQPRGAGDPRLDPRGRRTRLLARARARRRVRQPGPRRGLRDRRRRGGDRAAGHQLARGQVPRPGPGRRGAADPAAERVEDRQPDRAGPDPRGRADRAAARLRLGTGDRGRVGSRPGAL